MEEQINQNSQESSKMEKFKEGAKTTIFYVFIMVVVFFCGMFLSYLFYSHYRFQYVSGTSMQPTFNPGVLYPDSVIDPDYPEDLKKQDVVLIKMTKNVHAGEVVIVQVPGEEDTFIKRILAEDGDMISMIKTDPDSNGRSLYYTYVIKAGTEEPVLLDESYIPYNERINWTQDVNPIIYNNVTYEGFFFDCYLNPHSYRSDVNSCYDKDKIVTVSLNGKDVQFYKLDRDEIFFAGDHRRNSKDSRLIGTIKRKDIVGKTIAVIQDAKTYDDENTLWWEEIKTFFKSMWNEAINAFDW